MGPWNHWFFALAEHWGYWIVLAATFLETLPIVGGIFPGQTILIASGFLARVEILNPLIVIMLATVAAVIGDGLAFWFGRHYGLSVMERLGKFVAVSPAALTSTRQKLAQNAGKTLVIGRFLPVTRALAPFVAGASNVAVSRFFFFNIIGGLTWSTVSVMIGYLAGASYQIAASYFGRALMIAVVVIGLGWGILHWYRKQRTTLSTSTLGEIVINIAGLVAFSVLAYAATNEPALSRFDWRFSHWVSTLRTVWGVQFWSLVTQLFNPLPAVIWSVGLLVWTWRAEHKVGRWLPVVALVGGVGIGFFVKMATHRARPDLALIFAPGSSFPSLHATAVALLTLVVVWIVAPRLKSKWWRRWLPLMASLFCLLIGWSRVYLGVHWLSDVLAGYALALWWFSFVMILTKIFGSVRPRR